MPSFEQAHTIVTALSNDFAEHEKKYLSQEYNEAQARLDFIDKFLTALGWDVDHITQKNPYEQEVKIERNQKQGAANKKADYAFSLTPNYRDVRFFVEAKKPLNDIATADNCFQTVRYGWNSHNLIAVLTDFAHLHVLDCRYTPDINRATQRVWKTFHFREYQDPDKLAEIYWLFSREAVSTGSLDAEKLVQLLPKGKGKIIQRGLFRGGYQSIDELFLAELDNHRDTLARAFKNNNPDLDGETLTEITQRTIDRLVFIRFLEDRLIEDRHHVANYGEEGSAWADFIADCRQLDKIYNGIIFKEHRVLDAPTFVADDDAFGDVCESLAHVNSPYDFNAIPIHILGSIYERFLGKVIVATAKRAKVEDKPEVRKAGGVYYTPNYIVRYVVSKTVGQLIQGKNPEAVAKLRFIDIACGSGSFLLGVFDQLLEYYTVYYNKFPKQALKDDCFTHEDGSLRLTLKKRREILLNNIYGVDIDPQAVEVAQLSLYLRLLQDETASSAKQHQLEFHVTLLPSLHNNMKSGNSLIETDILFGQFEFSVEEERKLRPLDFASAFPGATQNGGFDVVVGNPPWGADLRSEELKYLSSKYSRVVQRMVDSYIYFTDRALRLIRDGGVIGYVIPSTVLNQVDAQPLRKIILDHAIADVVSLGKDIFTKKVLNTTTIIIAGRFKQPSAISVADLSQTPLESKASALLEVKTTNAQAWLSSVTLIPNKTFFTNASSETALLIRLQEKHKQFEFYTVSGIARGVSPDVAEAHVVPDELFELYGLEAEVLRRSISGKKIKRYSHATADQWLIYTAKGMEPKQFPRTYTHLQQFRSKNTCKEVVEGKHPWWALHRPRNPAIFESPKFIGLTTTKKIEIVLDLDDNLFVTDAMYVFQLKNGIHPNAALAVLNSKAFLSLYRISNQGESRVIPQIKAAKLGILPFPNLKDDRTPNKTVRLVEQMLIAKAQLVDAVTENDREYLMNKCAAFDRQIDTLVYELYGMTESEIRLVEAME